MSSALDEDTRRAIDDGRETAGAMLRAAQKDLQKVFIVFLVGFLGTFYALRLYVWGFLESVTRRNMNQVINQDLEIIAQTPFDVVLLQAKIGLVTGLIIAAPVFIYFSRDALRERDLWPSAPVPRWQLALIGTGMVVLFSLGVAYGYLFFFPITFEFLAQNTVNIGFSPKYSIVKWAQFMFLLTVSFGLASQLPLVMTILSYAEIVPYETFRDQWRYAVLGVFAAGALFTPPDPFTQILWAVPVLTLYGISLYISKVVVTARRGSEQLDFRTAIGKRWNLVVGSTALGGAVVYLYYTYGGPTAVNGLLDSVGSDYSIPALGTVLGVAPQTALIVWSVVGATVFTVIGLGYVVYKDIEESVGPLERGVGDPSKIDLRELDAMGVRAAPPEAFTDLSEDEAMAIAGDALDDGDKDKAQAIVDRFDEAEEGQNADAEAAAGADADDQPGELEDRATRAGGTFLSELTDGETDEDDIGGYYKDLAFIFETITSKTFRIVAVFMAALAGTFTWLYTVGFKAVFQQFLNRLPAEVRPNEVLNVVTLHPMEALLFEVKFSTLVAIIVTLPLVAYYAWPALRERNIVRRRRSTIFLWTGSLVVGLLGGLVLGYFYIAPAVISWLVNDAVQANMIISYRVTDFFWLIFFTTAGIGLLADVPILMVLLNGSGITYQVLRSRWREVTVGILTFAALFTPAGIVSMFLVTIPLMVAYGVGLAVLFVVTLGGRRNLAPARDSI
ncbi:preprotein translocase subunit TatC [Halogeometricum borinquense]|uniref:Sec-independent protein translocase protein TatC n=1 Tax=Halogeometricum borinquense TaxID=60847 RepID=A0A482TB39_9EURY|nr:twin-arginine translocase subunit TatC [Halogeometricum borinquense]RYJ15154.1 preprotein translocase subunit TatC [Halogeometricum borinquense]